MPDARLERTRSAYPRPIAARCPHCGTALTAVAVAVVEHGTEQGLTWHRPVEECPGCHARLQGPRIVDAETPMH